MVFRVYFWFCSQGSDLVGLGGGGVYRMPRTESRLPTCKTNALYVILSFWTNPDFVNPLSAV